MRLSSLASFEIQILAELIFRSRAVSAYAFTVDLDSILEIVILGLIYSRIEQRV